MAMRRKPVGRPGGRAGKKARKPASKTSGKVAGGPWKKPTSPRKILRSHLKRSGIGANPKKVMRKILRSIKKP